ncbi:FecR family protein [Flavivirga algicola]|uniref:FecR family protein n=1 Tax=Flavivirga algicola TaxID=2729136 RepID=A0ABX1RZM7_9FLAO|nr:FecR family protein [Flavivirga algicola]NMH89056.1 FecR family protein [Flavivirga algicola]
MEVKKILKYINETASKEEAREVEAWINASQDHAKKFNLLKAKHIASTFDDTINSADTNQGLFRYKTNIEKSSKNKSKNLKQSILKYAAIFIIAIGTSYLFFTENKLEIPEDTITLELENGDIKIIQDDGNAQFVDSKGNTITTQKGNKLNYNNSNISNEEKLVYNTLTVPYGKRFNIVLSDNTQVTLNAGTSMKYPVKFIKGHNREVFINGEAFFDVTKDKAHPFVVKSSDLNIRVLGTKFNVSSYPEDLNTKTVLVEGSVSLYQEETYKPKKATLLTPGHLAYLNKSNNAISLEKVDVSLHTSWINGSISFKHEPFKNILKKLERQYNVVIKCESKDLNETSFTARFDNASLEYILKTFRNNYDIKYTIENKPNKTITIKP